MESRVPIPILGPVLFMNRNALVVDIYQILSVSLEWGGETILLRGEFEQFCCFAPHTSSLFWFSHGCERLNV